MTDDEDRRITETITYTVGPPRWTMYAVASLLGTAIALKFLGISPYLATVLLYVVLTLLVAGGVYTVWDYRRVKRFIKTPPPATTLDDEGFSK